MTKIILASTAAIIATLGCASSSEAGWRHHNNHFNSFNIVIDAPRYVVDDYGYEGGDCYVKKTVRFNRYGERVVKKVKFCD